MYSSEDMEEETGANKASLENKKEIEFYPSMVNSLNEEELKSPALLKMIITKNKMFEKEIKRLEENEKNFYKCDKDLAIANEKLKQKTYLEIFTDVVYTIGGLIIAISTLDFKSAFAIHNGLFIIIGIILIFGAAIAKWGKK